MEGYQNPTLCAFLCIVQILVHCTLVCNAAVWIIETHKTGQLYGPTKQKHYSKYSLGFHAETNLHMK